jgi:prophage antirepressor-like protein
MKTDIQIFKNENFGEVRVTEVNGQPYFVGSDVAKALGYKKPYEAITQHVDNQDTVKRGISDNQGVPHEYVLVNESGMYSLIFGSKLESAKEFKRWVTSEVLPSIRKTGVYAKPQLSTLDILELTIKGMRENQQELQEVKQEVRELKAKVTTRPEEYTISGYASLNGMHVGLPQAKKLGKLATTLCHVRDIAISQTHDTKYGKINVYPVDILKEVFNMNFK